MTSHSDLNDISIISNATLQAWKWFRNTIPFSTDQNVTAYFTLSGDNNICLWISASSADGNISDMNCQFIRVYQYAQALAYSSSATSDYGFSFSGSVSNASDIAAWIWNFAGKLRSGQTSIYDFGAKGVYRVCLTAQAYGDLNRTICKNAEAQIDRKISNADLTSQAKFTLYKFFTSFAGIVTLVIMLIIAAAAIYIFVIPK
jgi:PKD repeat protein